MKIKVFSCGNIALKVFDWLIVKWWEDQLWKLIMIHDKRFFKKVEEN